MAPWTPSVARPSSSASTAPRPATPPWRGRSRRPPGGACRCTWSARAPIREGPRTPRTATLTSRRRSHSRRSLTPTRGWRRRRPPPDSANPGSWSRARPASSGLPTPSSRCRRGHTPSSWVAVGTGPSWGQCSDLWPPRWWPTPSVPWSSSASRVGRVRRRAEWQSAWTGQRMRRSPWPTPSSRHRRGVWASTSSMRGGPGRAWAGPTRPRLTRSPRRGSSSPRPWPGGRRRTRTSRSG